jgi:hypothetical protein
MIAMTTNSSTSVNPDRLFLIQGLLGKIESNEEGRPCDQEQRLQELGGSTKVLTTMVFTTMQFSGFHAFLK